MTAEGQEPDEGLTAAEQRQLAQRVQDLEAALEAERAARTPAGREAAADEREEAEEELETLAAELGLEPATTRRLLEAARRSARNELGTTVRTAVAEALEEFEPVPPAGDGDPPAGDGDPPAGDGDPPAASLEELQERPGADPPAQPPPAEQAPDPPPERQHWFHRPLVKREQEAES